MAKTIRVMVAEDFPLLREDFCDVVSAQSDMEVVGSAASGEGLVNVYRGTGKVLMMPTAKMPNV